MFAYLHPLVFSFSVCVFMWLAGALSDCFLPLLARRWLLDGVAGAAVVGELPQQHIWL